MYNHESLQKLVRGLVRFLRGSITIESLLVKFHEEHDRTEYLDSDVEEGTRFRIKVFSITPASTSPGRSSSPIWESISSFFRRRKITNDMKREWMNRLPPRRFVYDNITKVFPGDIDPKIWQRTYPGRKLRGGMGYPLTEKKKGKYLYLTKPWYKWYQKELLALGQIFMYMDEKNKPKKMAILMLSMEKQEISGWYQVYVFSYARKFYEYVAKKWNLDNITLITQVPKAESFAIILPDYFIEDEGEVIPPLEG